MSQEVEQLCSIIRRFEGLRLKAYLCPAGVWTIGYGATGKDIGPGVEWTLEQAEMRMAMDARRFLVGTFHLCPKASGSQLVALADFSYNLGLGRLAGSTLRRKYNAGDLKGAQDELKKWVRGGGKILPGLVARRKAEAELLVSQPSSTDSTMPVNGPVIVEDTSPPDPIVEMTPTLSGRVFGWILKLKRLWG